MVIIKTSCVLLLSLSLLFYLSDNWVIEPGWFSYSSSYTVVKRAKLAFKRRLLHWTASLVLPLVRWVLQGLEPLIISDNWTVQPPLEVWKDPKVQEYEDIFRSFDFSKLPRPKRGPKKNTAEVYAKAFLIKVNEKLQYSSDLREFFLEHPQVIPLVGFYHVSNEITGTLDLHRTVVSARYFRRKLQTMNNQDLKLLLKQTVDQLQAQHLLKGTVIADTTEILAWVKENNLKQRVKNRFDKHKPIKGFPECSLGAKPNPWRKRSQRETQTPILLGGKASRVSGTHSLWPGVFV